MGKNKKIYVLTKGSHSDYHIMGVCSTKEKAIEVVEKMNEKHKENEFYDKVEYEEYDLDLSSDCLSQGLYPYYVTMQLDGSDAKCRLQQNYGNQDNTNVVLVSYPAGFPERVLSHVVARDEQHAIKIMNERRLMYKASKGVTDGR